MITSTTYITPSTLDGKTVEWLNLIAEFNFRKRTSRPRAVRS